MPRLVDPFGTIYFIKGILVTVFGLVSWFRLNRANKLHFEGLEIIRQLPDRNVLFVSNHQTYYADVTAINHGFNVARNRRSGNIGDPFYLFPPFVRSYYVAAFETMRNSGVLPVIFAYAGGILVKRTWRAKGKDVHRAFSHKDQDKILKAIRSGWVVTFPQGTTKPFSPIRKGTAHIIEQTRPIVVPVQVEGFRRAFDKKGLYLKMKGTNLYVRFKEALDLSGLDQDAILDRIMNEIGQTSEPLNPEGK